MRNSKDQAVLSGVTPLRECRFAISRTALQGSIKGVNLAELEGAGDGEDQVRHVWVLNHYAQEPGGTGGTRHYSLARHLRGYGWTATIIASSVEHRSGRQRLTRREKRRIQQFDGVPFLWLRTTGYSGNGASRIWNMLQYSVQIAPKRARQRSETCFSSWHHIRSSCCLIPRFDGAILSQEWKEALWDKFVTGA